VAREIEEAQKKLQRDKEVAEVLLLQRKSIEAQNLEERQRIKIEEAMMKEKIEKEVREEKMAGKLNLQRTAVSMNKTVVISTVHVMSEKLQTFL
jgi:hypothetical protein